MATNRQTSLISILSTEHGRLRREQRDIDKRDLQRALKYGARERCWGERWRVVHDGIVFITDDAMRTEITAFPAPLASAEIDSTARSDHAGAKLLIKRKPGLCKTHTVLVVDNSGSMNVHDINLHRDRQTAAYASMAMEFVAEQLFNGTANNSDVVSLVEFSKHAQVIFTKEPVSWVLYNKLLSRRGTSTFKTRESATRSDAEECDSNYLPALESARRLLGVDFHEDCALSIFFLSDGASTDARELGLTPAAAQRRMCSSIHEIASKFGGNLSITMVGFGSALGNFSVLKEMVKAVDNTTTKAEFVYCGKMAKAIGDAVTSLVTSLTATRTSLGCGGVLRYTKRVVDAEDDGFHANSNWRFHRIINHIVFHPGLEKWIRHPGLPPGALKDDNRRESRRRLKSPPPFAAISVKTLGRGAERLAFRCQLSDNEQLSGLVFGAMVAKETLSVERIEENVDFHRGFFETQSLAASLASEFNLRLQAIPGYNEKTTPRISFIECSVLLLEDPEWPSGKRGVLVEKMLDTARHQWCKWNDNAGAVNGKVAHVPIDVNYELARLKVVTDHAESTGMGIIAEGDSSEEDESSDDDDSYGDSSGEERAGSVSPSEYLQAFTHFTYRFTNKKVMVCDLQGIYNDEAVPPTFELTDPAIHYASKRRYMVFGRTDKGKKGMQLFFNTHTCSSVCKRMQLSKHNPNWRRDWHQSEWLAQATEATVADSSPVARGLGDQP